jgi:hypothetical protein
MALINIIFYKNIILKYIEIMPRPRVLTDEQRLLNKKKHNENPDLIERKRMNSLFYYERKRLEKYILENGTERGFKYVHLKVNF